MDRRVSTRMLLLSLWVEMFTVHTSHVPSCLHKAVYTSDNVNVNVFLM